MPQIDESNPVLYKYRSLDINTLEMLRSGKVWFSHRRQLNDPFDCTPNIDMYMDDQSTEKMFQMSGRQLPDDATIEQMRADLIEHLNQTLDKSGVFCVTSTNNNELMWAHYADNHYGLAIGYQPDSELFHDKSLIRYLPCKVGYDGPGTISGKNILSRMERQEPKGDIDDATDAMFFSKNPIWNYENEYRFISPLSYGLKSLKASVCSVIYGMRFDGTKRELVKKFLPEGAVEYSVVMGDKELQVVPIIR